MRKNKKRPPDSTALILAIIGSILGIINSLLELIKNLLNR